MKLSNMKKIILAAALVVSSTSAFAMMKENSNMNKYSDKAFSQALNAGDMIVLDFYKKGCAVCAKQHPTLKQAAVENPKAKFFRINFKKDLATVSKFKVGSQSTIITFNNGKEINRTVGQTKKASLMDQINAAKSM